MQGSAFVILISLIVVKSPITPRSSLSISIFIEEFSFYIVRDIVKYVANTKSDKWPETGSKSIVTNENTDHRIHKF